MIQDYEQYITEARANSKSISAEQMIKKACEWLKENVNDYLFDDGKEMADWKVNVEEMLDDFKKAMEK